ncbi:uncharacterized protein [Medicago truncatula]|uniref:uncharacterized protein isoform X1 n=1 Tax=Medicago truncatula TaxID=3880 RepID=UPI0000D5DBD1|nr:uncharacterized protein LOC11423231 isoform X1 [Medicago truncatula]
MLASKSSTLFPGDHRAGNHPPPPWTTPPSPELHTGTLLPSWCPFLQRSMQLHFIDFCSFVFYLIHRNFLDYECLLMGAYSPSNHASHRLKVTSCVISPKDLYFAKLRDKKWVTILVWRVTLIGIDELEIQSFRSSSSTVPNGLTINAGSPEVTYYAIFLFGSYLYEQFNITKLAGQFAGS